MKKSKPYVIGLTFIIAIVVFVWGFNFLKGRDIFKKQEFLYARYHSVNGLVAAKPVYINGVQVGQVSRLYFAPDYSGDVIVEFLIQTDFPIPKNTVAHIFSADLMGSKSVALQLGDSPELAHSGDTLLSSVEGSLMESVNQQVEPLKAKAEMLLGSIDTLVAAFNAVLNEASQKNLANSIKDIRATFRNLATTTSNIDTLVDRESNRLAIILANIDSISAALKNSRGDFTNMIANLSEFSDSLANLNLNQTMTRLNSSLTHIDSLLASIRQGNGTAGKLIYNDSLYYELNKSAEELNLLLKDIRENPKKYVKFSLF